MYSGSNRSAGIFSDQHAEFPALDNLFDHRRSIFTLDRAHLRATSSAVRHSESASIPRLSPHAPVSRTLETRAEPAPPPLGTRISDKERRACARHIHQFLRRIVEPRARARVRQIATGPKTRSRRSTARPNRDTLRTDRETSYPACPPREAAGTSSICAEINDRPDRPAAAPTNRAADRNAGNRPSSRGNQVGARKPSSRGPLTGFFGSAWRRPTLWRGAMPCDKDFQHPDKIDPSNSASVIPANFKIQPVEV